MTERTGAGRGLLSLLAILLALAWPAVVAFVAWRGWPHLPLDVSASDPATVAAYRGAVLRHAGVAAAVALVPTAALLLVARRLGRRRR